MNLEFDSNILLTQLLPMSNNGQDPGWKETARIAQELVQILGNKGDTFVPSWSRNSQDFESTASGKNYFT